jgi:hypothetical protein
MRVITKVKTAVRRARGIDGLTPVPVRDGAEGPYDVGYMIKGTSKSRDIVITASSWDDAMRKAKAGTHPGEELYRVSPRDKNAAWAKDTLTPVPVSPGSSGKALAIAKHNAGVTRSQDRRVKDTFPVFNLSPVPMPEDEHDRGRLAQPEYPALDALRSQGRANDALRGQARAKDAGPLTQKCANCGMPVYKDMKYDVGQWKHGGTSQAHCSGGPGSSQFPELWPKKATPVGKATDALRGLTPVGKAKDGDVNVGEKIHLGFGTRGGAGFEGIVTKIEGDTVYIKNSEGRTFKGPLRFASKAGVEDALRGLTPVGV